MPLFDPKPVTTIQEFINALKEVSSEQNVRWFRGHAEAEWKLVPRLGRVANHPALEIALIKRFKQNAYSLITPTGSPPELEWQWLFLMQHHGAPTRLLDWSENPLVGLYFAVSDGDGLRSEHDEHDGKFWCLDPVALNKYAHMELAAGELPYFGIDKELEVYAAERVRTVPMKKPPVAAMAARYFPRLRAQSGVFTVTHQEQTALEDVDGGSHVGCLIIPKGNKAALRKDLAALGITRLALFPELDSVAAHAGQVLS